MNVVHKEEKKKHAYNPSTKEAETGRQEAQGQPGLHLKTVSETTFLQNTRM